LPSAFLFFPSDSSRVAAMFATRIHALVGILALSLSKGGCRYKITPSPAPAERERGWWARRNIRAVRARARTNPGGDATKKTLDYARDFLLGGK